MTARPTFPGAVAGAVAAILSLALAMSPVFADTASKLGNAKDDLHALERQIAAQQAQIATLRRQALNLAGQLDTVQTKQAQTQAKIVNLQQQIRDATNEMDATQAQLNQRAWVAYEQGIGSNLEFILGSTSLEDLNLRLQIVDNASQGDRDLIDQIQEQKLRLQARKNDLGELEAELLAQGKDLKKKNDAIQAKLTEADAIQTQLNADQAAAQRKVDGLKQKLAAEEAAAEAARLAALAAKGGQTIHPGGEQGGNWVPGM